MPASEVPEDVLPRFIRDTKFISDEAMDDEDSRQEAGTMPRSTVPIDSSSDGGPDTSSGGSADNKGGTETSSGGGTNNVGTSSLSSFFSGNKRKYNEAEGESSSQPSKQFKQDSSDITGDTEPYDFTGGDE
ncbi:hypothetical protein DID88_003329 [Monilinia fructigena]|uniref:Uncharacterized protein n=1 Tax=Monilinia fructigena TaxID=38457 RepID=A0A395ICJ2_9HELO|nr:hypothetical protein DID88_010024 [Monilinia fructigena]RAL58579.1 hypothetical protein DID88_003329 [Monilinia fructigena]